MLPVSPLEGSLAATHEIFAKGSKTTLKSGGSASGIDGTKNISHIEGIGSYIHQAFSKKKICDISFQVGDFWRLDDASPQSGAGITELDPSLRKFLRRRNFCPNLSPQRLSVWGMWTLLPWKSLSISCIRETSKNRAQQCLWYPEVVVDIWSWTTFKALHQWI